MLQIEVAHHSWRDLDALYPLAQTLAQYFPQPTLVVTAIYELLLNGMEHGNLGIGFEEKTQLLREGRWREEITRRMGLPECAARRLMISLTAKAHGCELSIADQGGGFAWQQQLQRTMPSARPNGRGLYIAFTAPFEHIAFNAAGNCITCRSA